MSVSEFRGHISSMARPFGAPRFLMDENASASVPGIAVLEAPAGTPDVLTLEDAGRLTADLRVKRRAPVAEVTETPATESAEPATVGETESTSQGDDATPPEPAVTGETQEEAPAVTPEKEEKPSRPLPRSWTKDQTDHWTKLDPATQDFLVEQDRKASEAVRRSQNEAAEARKGVDAERVKWEQAVKQQEVLTPARLEYHALLQEQLRVFPDIRTESDLVKLESDPLRAVQWNLHQQRLAGAQAKVQAAEKFETDARQTKRNTYLNEQSARLKELVPDFADAKKLAAERERAMPLLEEYGFSLDQLNKWVATEAGFEILQSAGFQKLVADQLSSRDRDAERTATETKRAADEAKHKEELAKKLAKTPVPPVQKPGTAPVPGDAASQNLKQLSQKLSTTGSFEDALALLKARRSPPRR